MSLLLNCQDISKSFGLIPVFSGIDLSIRDKERLGIIGPNGAGKSTLLKIIAGLDRPDRGLISPKRGLQVGYVTQHKDYNGNESVREVLFDALAGSSQEGNKGKVESLIGRAGFPDANASSKDLSGGWKKRLSICEEIVKDPELLLLDEPTNHLDLDGIEWLEDYLASTNLALCFISHDRYFLESVATRIIEINQIFPRGFFETSGGYGEFMEHKSLFLEGQEATLASMANKLRTETAWLQRGAQARSTKQQARIKSATQLKSFLESSQQRTRTLDVAFQFSSSSRKSKKLIDVVSVAKSFVSRCLFKDVTFTLGPGLRLGLLGPNGSGKSTLLKIIQRKLEPDQGQVEHAEKLRIVYYDQQRAQLPTDMTLRRALSPDSDSVVFQNRSLHVASYCKMFGFRTDQLDTNVDRLSGGEKARLLIARMLLIPADVLILDEPTNDLDIDTLSMLEESLISFSGTVVLVTHDRYMMDRVCNGLLGFMGDSKGIFYADYAQYVLGVAARREEAKGAASLTKTPNTDKPNTAPRTSKKLSYNEQREWDAMEARILEAETALEEANALVQSTDIASNAGKLADACLSAQKAQTLVDTLYARWTELENKQKD